MTDIHPTAIVSPKAQLAENVKIGPYAIIDDDVQIGEGTVIHSHAVIRNGARIGKRCAIFNGAMISEQPQDLKYAGEATTTEIGDDTTIREFATIHRGTIEHGKTVIGSHTLIMAYVHIAHDCEVGNHCILSNTTQVAGHVNIHDWAILGGMVAVHQFVNIGAHVFIGGAFRVAKDIPPYILAAGEPLKYAGLNQVGLKRRGFSEETIDAIAGFYRVLYRKHLNYSDAIAYFEKSNVLIPEIEYAIQFVKGSERGIL